MKLYRLFLIGALLLALAGCNAPLEPTAAPANPTLASSPTQTALSPTTTPPTAPAPSLAGTAWTLLSYGPPGSEMPVVSSAQTTLAFEANGQVSGSGGCNSYGGSYQVTGDSLSFSQLISTKMACANPNLNRQEQQFFDALQSASTFSVSGNQLTIQYAGGQSALHFSAGIATPAPEPTETSAPATTPTASATAAAATATSAPTGSTPALPGRPQHAHWSAGLLLQRHQPQRIPARLLLLARSGCRSGQLRALPAGLPGHAVRRRHAGHDQ